MTDIQGQSHSSLAISELQSARGGASASVTIDRSEKLVSRAEIIYVMRINDDEGRLISESTRLFQALSLFRQQQTGLSIK